MVYKHFFFLTTNNSTRAVKLSVVPLVQAFSPSITLLSLKMLLFSAARVFAKSLNVSNAGGVACRSRTFTSYTLPVWGVSRFCSALYYRFFRSFAYIYYFKGVLAWVNSLNSLLRSYKKFLRGGNKVRRGAQGVNTGSVCIINRFYCGNLRRLRKAAVSSFLKLKRALPLLKTFSTYEYATALHTFMVTRLAFFSSSLVSLVKRGLMRLKFLFNLKKIKPVTSFVIADSVSRVCRLNYFVKFSTYLLNSSSVTGVIFNGTFSH